MKINNLKDKVYKSLLLIPKGKVTTYKNIAIYLGNKNLSRVVGNILHVNHNPKKYPCYKVVNSKGELAKNFGDGGLKVQKIRLGKDGIEVKNNRVDLKKYLFKFKK